MTLQAGTKLGPYEIQSVAGAGGMGEVYRARDTRLERTVAIKVLPESFASDPDRLRRFEQEARTVAALNHPNIMAVYDIGENAGSPYMVSELLDGETLREKMKEGALGQRCAVEYASQMAEGLAAAHDKGVVHRDLKPENVFVTNDGRVKVLDFGLAKLRAHTASGGAPGDGATMGTQTSPGMVLGTAGYMSPEQIRGKEVDARTDIFAFGAILYEMLSGRRAFKGESSVETMNAILKEDPPELETEKLKVSPGLERIVRRCLEKEPARRFHSARDVGFALEAISGTSVSSTQQHAIAATNTRWAWRAGVAAGVLAAVAVLAFYAGTRAGSPANKGARNFRLLTFKPQIIFRAVFAPDGKSIVFAAARSGNSPEIFTLSPDYPEPRVTNLRNTQLLAVSSKGELAVLTNPRYASHRVFGGTLARGPLEGSAPREVLEDVYEADWTPDGSDLLVTRMVAGRFRLEYPVGRVLAETSGYFSDPRFSPKGDKIAFFEHPLRFDDRGTVAVVDLAGNKKVLTELFSGEEGLAWSSGGKEILFSAGTDYPSFSVRAVTLEGNQRTIMESAGGLMLQDVNQDGQWLVTREDQRRQMLGAGPGARSELDLTFLDSSHPQKLSADGKSVLFTDDNGIFGKNYSVCLRRMDGSATVRLGEGEAEDLSPDGTLALAVILTSPDKLVVYPTGAGPSWQVQTGQVHNIDTANWLPDGKRLVICGSESGHGARCYLADARAGNPVAITPEGAASGCRINSHSCPPSPDGSEVLVRDAKGRYFVYPLAGGQGRLVSILKENDGILAWSQDRKSLIVRAGGWEPSVDLERVDVATGRRTLVKRLAPSDPGTLAIHSIVVADDGKAYAYGVKIQRSSLFLVNGAK